MSTYNQVISELKSNFLTIIKQDDKILKQLVLDDKPYEREDQVIFQTRPLDSAIYLDFLPNKKIIITRERELEPIEYVNVYNIQDAYKQVRYFANNGRLKGAEAL